MNVKVAVRVRPFNSRERGLNCTCVVDMKDKSTVLIPQGEEKQHTFTFDYSFWSFDGSIKDEKGYYKPDAGSKYCDQRKVYDAIGATILDNAWKGYHCCLFAYGQTGSGKSYSMIGTPQNLGVVPIVCTQIFNQTKAKKNGDEYEIKVSMLEIYNETVQDLMTPTTKRPTKGLEVRENKILGIYVDGATKQLVNSFTEIETVMAEGTKNRTIAATQMNATSSRAHTIITIEFKQTKKIGDKSSSIISVINLVDLAGSERQSKTQATGDRLKEAIGINTSLTALGQVISTLAENSDGGNKFVPYRNSVLTRILTSALGGNSQTVMICAISPANDNYDETLSTLRYAERAKKIKNVPIVNQSQSDKLIRELKQENQRLKKLLAEKQIPITNTIEGNKKEQTVVKKEQTAVKKQQTAVKKEQIAVKKQDNAVKKQQHQIKKQQHQIKKEQIPVHKQQIPIKKQQQNTHKQPPKQNIQQISQAQAKRAKQQKQLQRQLQNVQKLLKQQSKSLQTKQKQAKQVLKQIVSTNQAEKNKIVQLTKNNPNIPFLDYISKDFLLHRKLKIFLQKPLLTVGKTWAVPPHDIPLGGRDIQFNHAILETTTEGVFLSPVATNCHLYCNGKQVTAKTKLNHLDRVIFGWNSVFILKNKDYDRTDERIDGKKIDWEFVKNEVKLLVDIDMSDSEEINTGCCQIY